MSEWAKNIENCFLISVHLFPPNVLCSSMFLVSSIIQIRAIVDVKYVSDLLAVPKHLLYVTQGTQTKTRDNYKDMLWIDLKLKF